jgi:uncharacterized protein
MSRSTLISLVVVFVLSVAAGFFLFQGRSSLGLGDVVELDWRLLGELDYVTGKAPGELQALDGKEVKIPGFMVPLEDNQKAVTEFLLVPSPQACIHVPPPPPNQMVLVNMDPSAQSKVEFGPIWVVGKLSLKSKRHMYGESSFQMTGMRIEPYR